MPMPPPEKVRELVAGVIDAAGCDLEDVIISAAGRRSVVRIVVDSDAGPGMDDVAELSRAISAVLDTAPSVGEAAYTLEVTTPGVDRPLTDTRHWERARGRRVSVALEEETVTGRVGRCAGGQVQLVTTGSPSPQVRTIALEEVRRAVVEVEFAPADPAELAVTGAPRGHEQHPAGGCTVPAGEIR